VCEREIDTNSDDTDQSANVVSRMRNRGESLEATVNAAQYHVHNRKKHR